MRGLCIVLVWLSWLSVSPALAQLYRWTDAQGKVHITDNPAAIPPGYRERAHSSTPDEPIQGSESDNAPSPTVVPQSPRGPGPASEQSAAPSPTAQQGPTRQRLQALEQEIVTARQERQGYLDQLRHTRTVQATPVFVRQRRQLADAGRALVAIEQRLDTLAADVARLQTQIEAQQPSPITQRTRDQGLDTQGHDATYWQQRANVILPRLQQAQSQRREILAQLAAITTDEIRPAERQGRGLIQHAEALHQVETDLETATEAWHALQQEAQRAGVPPEWLQ